MIFWNIVTFLGHEAVERLTPMDIHGATSLTQSVVAPLTLTKVIYLIAKVDHLIFTPALFVLVLSLRAFVKREDS